MKICTINIRTLLKKIRRVFSIQRCEEPVTSTYELLFKAAYFLPLRKNPITRITSAAPMIVYNTPPVAKILPRPIPDELSESPLDISVGIKAARTENRTTTAIMPYVHLFTIPVLVIVK